MKNKTYAEENLTYGTVRSIQSFKLKRNTKISRAHVILDFYKCNENNISKTETVERKIKKITDLLKLSTKIQSFYQFEPFGVTAIVCTEDFHFAMHTWPELNSGAIDLYCNKGRKLAMEVIGKLKDEFCFGEYEMKVRRR